MNKLQFMPVMEYHLRPLPSSVRRKMMEDYETPFEFGKHSGKSEEDISRELGDPVELAKELLGGRL